MERSQPAHSTVRWVREIGYLSKQRKVSAWLGSGTRELEFSCEYAESTCAACDSAMVDTLELQVCCYVPIEDNICTS